MNRVGDHFLSGARLSTDDDRRVGVGHLGDLLVDFPHRARGTDDCGKVVFFFQLAQKVGVFVHQATALFVRPDDLP